MNKKKVVIIGGGTAGLVIAENLGDVFDIVVLEKSRIRRPPLLNRIPLLIGLLYRSKVLKYIKKLDIVAQDGRRVPFFESCVLGGASVVNGCVHAIGAKCNWKIELKKFGFGYDEVALAHKNLYTESVYSLGKNIKLRPSSLNELDKCFFRSLETFGLSETGLLSSDHSGFGRVINTVGFFLRSSVLSLIRSRNLKIFIGQNVIQIKCKPNKKFEVITQSDTFHADAVILSSGVIGTNLLFLEKRISGVNDMFLHQYNVGEYVKDHSNVRVNVRASRSVGSLNEINKNFIEKFYMFGKHFLGQGTLMRGTGATSGVHLDLDGDGEVDTRINLLKFSEGGRHKSDGNDFCSGPGFSLSITPIKTKSFGRIIIDEGGGPLINPGYFNEQIDLDLMKSALFFCLDLLATDPLKRYVLEIEDYDLAKNNPEKFIKKSFFSGHHLIGGCSNLIDENFEVRDKPGIFVCDASVFSEFVSSNIHAPVVILAKLFSERFVAGLNCNGRGNNNARI